MEKKETTTEEIALDIISNLNGYLNELKQKGTRRAKKKIPTVCTAGISNVC